jgi:hypothetical protein
MRLVIGEAFITSTATKKQAVTYNLDITGRFSVGYDKKALPVAAGQREARHYS